MIKLKTILVGQSLMNQANSQEKLFVCLNVEIKRIGLIKKLIRAALSFKKEL